MEQIAFNQYKYVYPPRPINRISVDEIGKYDNGEYLAQPKYDGTCVNVFISENFLKVMNRHNQEIANPYFTDIDYTSIHKGKGFMVVSGELLNKNKTGEDGKPFNKCLVLWDVLVYEGEYLLGQTTEQRLILLESLYPCQRMQVSDKGIESYEHICCTGIKGIYKAPTYTKYFTALYNDLIKTQLYEGIVLKRSDAKLTFGFNEKNNFEYTLKCRKETKNYKF